MKAIAIVDANNFYVSCERLFNPRLRGQAAVVLSNNDGCIVSRSNEAKELKIGMGVPLFQVSKIIEQNGVHVLSSNYELYGDMSHRMMEVLEECSPEVERYSIDEAFISLEAEDSQGLEELGRAIRARIYRHVGIPVSIGIAATKTLAKVAGHHAKVLPDLEGVFDLTPPSIQIPVLRNTPIEEVWGIGWRLGEEAKDEWYFDGPSICAKLGKAGFGRTCPLSVCGWRGRFAASPVTRSIPVLRPGAPSIQHGRSARWWIQKTN